MFSKVLPSSSIAYKNSQRIARCLGTTVEKQSGGAIGEDGKHEVWRDGIYDHDNEPMVSNAIPCKVF